MGSVRGTGGEGVLRLTEGDAFSAVKGKSIWLPARFFTFLLVSIIYRRVKMAFDLGQKSLTAENLIVGPPEISSFGEPAVELVSVRRQNQPANTGQETVTRRPLTGLRQQTQMMRCLVMIIIIININRIAHSAPLSAQQHRGVELAPSSCRLKARVIPHRTLIHRHHGANTAPILQFKKGLAVEPSLVTTEHAGTRPAAVCCSRISNPSKVNLLKVPKRSSEAAASVTQFKP